MFTGTQCDLWSRPVGTGHEKSKSREIPSTYFYTLIPSLHEHEASGGGHGRCLYCRLTSFSRSLQTILRINLDGTVKIARYQKQSGQLPTQEKMKTAVVRMDFPTTAANLGDNIHFLFFCYWSCEVHPLRNASCNSILPRKNKVNY